MTVAANAASIVATRDAATSTSARRAQDTVAYVPREGGPVDTSTYMWAGYAIVWGVLVLYVVMLFRRTARVRGTAPGMDSSSAS